MAEKPNMYRGKLNEAKETVEKINDCVVLREIEEDGSNKIKCYLTQKSKDIRDEVCVMKGKLEVLCEGLDKSSEKKKQYSELLDACNSFLSATKEKKYER